jgi:U3 small nucleolar RNA-associated protein 25
VRLLLYTERAHFYHRWSIRGVQDVVFYGVPLHGGYYAEIVNLMEGGRAGGGSGSAHGTVTAMFSAYDRLALARVVGASRADKMVTGESPTYMFC